MDLQAADFKAAFQGAVTGGAFGYVGSFADPVLNYAGHALVGCASGAMNGGGGEGCARGAVSQVISKWVTLRTETWGPAGQFAAATIAGGTTSVITGGKFATGAQTAAFGYLFNQLVSDRARAAQILQTEGLMPGDRTGLFPSGHVYGHLDLICDAGAAGCSVDSVFNGVRRFPAPGADGSARVETGMITNVSIPGMVLGTDHVLHEVNPSARRVFNFTLGDHVLNPGWVSRTVFQVGTSVYVYTYGAGGGSNPFNVNGNQTVVNQVWGGTNNNIRRCVAAGSC